jgi:hypothetical protein
MKTGTFFLLALILRIFFILHHDIGLNPDEKRNWKIAENHLTGNGYTYNGKQTGFHSSFCVFLYEGLQRAGISQKSWEWFCMVLSVILFYISAYYFRDMLNFFVSEKVSAAGVILYLFYPSNIYYIGSILFYENLVMPALVITVSLLLSALIAERNLKKGEIAFIFLAAVFSSWLRPSVLFVYFFLFLTSAILFAQKKIKTRGLFVVIISALALFQLPAAYKHKLQFGHYVLSTQSGFELLQGHNELARGSFRQLKEDADPLEIYVEKRIPGLQKMNEYEESQARKNFALQWIKENPAKEIALVVRKIAIYFAPQNYIVLPFSQWYNPINAFAHIGFILFCFKLIFSFKKTARPETILLMVVPASVLILNVIFFVVYRARYFAEPFMLLFAVRLFHDYFYSKNIAAQ